MIKLDLPIDCMNYTQVIDSCINKMRKSNILRIKLEENKQDLIKISKSYMEWGRDNLLFKYKYCTCEEWRRDNLLFEYCTSYGHQPLNMGTYHMNNKLIHDDMVKVYDTYIVKNRCGGFYDKILNSARNPKIQCPFCCGIGYPHEVDHFLPKSKLSYYAIFPYNLIPICKDCNQIYKKTYFPKYKDQQLIHPYLDDEKIFNEEWLYAKCIINTKEPIIKFYVKPPLNWEEDKKGKIKFHFKEFNLAERFAVHAIKYLGELLAQIEKSKSQGLTRENVETCIIDPVIDNEKLPNSWKKALFLAVKEQLPAIWANL